MIRIGFFTGWRCEYGLTFELLKVIDSSPDFDLLIYPNGLHFLEKYGYTISEIKNDGFRIGEEIHTYSENGDEKVFELTNSINMTYKVLKRANLDGVLVNGDRIEAYATALAAHFMKLPVFHIGGGVITEGAVDNIYRYNITNLSSVSFVTTQRAFNRLKNLEIIDKNNVHLVGSTAIDRIISFRDNPELPCRFVEGLKNKDYCLMTFHPVTNKSEPIGELMDWSIKMVSSKGYDIVITYPNNDEGCESILEVIEDWKSYHNIHVKKNLGSRGYYAAINESKFVIGNSSSGVIEAPYFNKPVLNIGSRQEGRDKDTGIVDVEPNIDSLNKALEMGFQEGWVSKECHYLYGDGSSSEKIKNVIKKYFTL
jgi:UDP-hydrolysing UDP-N-acetyl-D-glucosamine 2-epimerase|tara:strand:- start:440 stop:1543 length:1104 start_codon:yes stop_codon:yes gene_type:complete